MSVTVTNRYARAGALPNIGTYPPGYDYANDGTSAVSVLNYNPRLDYYVALTATKSAWRARVTFGKRRVYALQPDVETAFTVLANDRVFVTFSPSQEGLVLLQMNIINNKQADVRVWVNINSIATERSWIKWVGGNDTEIDTLTTPFYTSVQLVKYLGYNTAAWTFQCAQQLDWVVQPTLLLPIVIKLDSPSTFVMDRASGAALFKLQSDTVGKGKLYFQVLDQCVCIRM
jgi:hypothetical protein